MLTAETSVCVIVVKWTTKTNYDFEHELTAQTTGTSEA